MRCAVCCIRAGNTAARNAAPGTHDALALLRTTFLPTAQTWLTQTASTFAGPQEWGNLIRSASDFLCFHSTIKYAKK